MARNRSAFNPTDQPVVVDDNGTQIDGGSWDKVEAQHPLVTAAVESGRLVLASEATTAGEPAGLPDPEVVDRAKAALERQASGQQPRSSADSGGN